MAFATPLAKPLESTGTPLRRICIEDCLAAGDEPRSETFSVASSKMLGEGVVAYGYDSRCGLFAACDYASPAAGQGHISVGEYVNQQERQGSDSDS